MATSVPLTSRIASSKKSAGCAPDLEPNLIEDVLEGFNVVESEAPAEIARGGGVGDAVGAEGVEEDDVVAAQFDVVEASAITEGVVSKIENVIGFVVREVTLEQVETIVNGLDQSEFTDHQMNATDASARDGLGLVGDLIVDVRGGDDGLGRWRGDGSIESPTDFVLARGVVTVWNGFHSKSPCLFGHRNCEGQSNVPETPGDFELFLENHVGRRSDHAWLRLNLGRGATIRPDL